ncbi:MAG: hypothetical protein AABW61_00945, partial [Candidatus Aenigmatarchaeota archaeon]
IVTDIDKEILTSYAAVFIYPLLRQGTQTSYKIPISANGTRSPKIGDLVIEPDAKSGIKVTQVEDTPNGARVIAVYKPEQKTSYRNGPSVSYTRSLGEHVDHHVEAQGKYRERAEKLGVQDTPYDQLPSSENAAYVKYGDDSSPNNFGFASAACADEEGVYFTRVPFESREIGLTEPNKAQVERIQERVLRHVIETTFDEGLREAERQRDYDEMIKVLGELPKMSIVKAMEEIGASRGLQYSAPEFSYTTIAESNGILRIETRVAILTGTGVGPSSRQDARHMVDMVNRLGKISLGSVDGLYLERNGYAKISVLPNGSEPRKMGHSHVVRADFVSEFPEEMLPIIYNQNKDLVRPAT